MKQGHKIPVVTGSYNDKTSQTESQVTYLDVGMNFDATLESLSGGGRLRTKVEQLGMAEEKSGVGPQDPIVRQSALDGTDDRRDLGLITSDQEAEEQYGKYAHFDKNAARALLAESGYRDAKGDGFVANPDEAILHADNKWPTVVGGLIP